MRAILLKWKAWLGGVRGGEGVSDVNSRGQLVTADIQTEHLLYTVYSATGALLSYVITDVSIEGK